MFKKWDDALDVWAVHGMSGILGSILTGVFAISRIGGASGLIEGSTKVFYANLVTTITVLAFSFVVTYLILKIMSFFINLKVDEREAEASLDRALHGEEAYEF